MGVRCLGLAVAFVAGTAAAQVALVDAARNDDHATAVALLARVDVRARVDEHLRCGGIAAARDDHQRRLPVCVR